MAEYSQSDYLKKASRHPEVMEWLNDPRNHHGPLTSPLDWLAEPSRDSNSSIPGDSPSAPASPHEDDAFKLSSPMIRAADSGSPTDDDPDNPPPAPAHHMTIHPAATSGTPLNGVYPRYRYHNRFWDPMCPRFLNTAVVTLSQALGFNYYEIVRLIINRHVQPHAHVDDDQQQTSHRSEGSLPSSSGGPEMPSVLQTEPSEDSESEHDWKGRLTAPLHVEREESASVLSAHKRISFRWLADDDTRRHGLRARTAAGSRPTVRAEGFQSPVVGTATRANYSQGLHQEPCTPEQRSEQQLRHALELANLRIDNQPGQIVQHEIGNPTSHNGQPSPLSLNTVDLLRPNSSTAASRLVTEHTTYRPLSYRNHEETWTDRPDRDRADLAVAFSRGMDTEAPTVHPGNGAYADRDGAPVDKPIADVNAEQRQQPMTQGKNTACAPHCSSKNKHEEPSNSPGDDDSVSRNVEIGLGAGVAPSDSASNSDSRDEHNGAKTYDNDNSSEEEQRGRPRERERAKHGCDSERGGECGSDCESWCESESEISGINRSPREWSAVPRNQIEARLARWESFQVPDWSEESATMDIEWDINLLGKQDSPFPSCSFEAIQMQNASNRNNWILMILETDVEQIQNAMSFSPRLCLLKGGLSGPIISQKSWKQWAWRSMILRDGGITKD